MNPPVTYLLWTKSFRYQCQESSLVGIAVNHEAASYQGKVKTEVDKEATLLDGIEVRFSVSAL